MLCIPKAIRSSVLEFIYRARLQDTSAVINSGHFEASHEKSKLLDPMRQSLLLFHPFMT